MNKLEEAAKAYQEKEQSMWTGKGMAKDFQDAFIAGAEWFKEQSNTLSNTRDLSEEGY